MDCAPLQDRLLAGPRMRRTLRFFQFGIFGKLLLAVRRGSEWISGGSPVRLVWLCVTLPILGRFAFGCLVPAQRRTVHRRATNTVRTPPTL